MQYTKKYISLGNNILYHIEATDGAVVKVFNNEMIVTINFPVIRNTVFDFTIFNKLLAFD